MSRIHTPAIEAATGATAEIYARIKENVGKVPNAYAAIGAAAPAVLNAMLQSEGVLATGSLSGQDRETIKIIVSGVAGCDYCVAAHSMLGKMAGLKPDVLKQIRAGAPTGDDKRDALARFVRTLASTSGTLAESEFKAIKDAGYTDGQVVEISFAMALVTFTNVFNRINNTVVDFPPIG